MSKIQFDDRNAKIEVKLNFCDIYLGRLSDTWDWCLFRFRIPPKSDWKNWKNGNIMQLPTTYSGGVEPLKLIFKVLLGIDFFIFK